MYVQLFTFYIADNIFLQYFIAKSCSSCCFKVHSAALGDDSESICAGESG